MSDGQSTTTHNWAVTTSGATGAFPGTWRSIWADPEVTVEVTGLYVSTGPATDSDRVVLERARLESPNQLYLGQTIHDNGALIYNADTSFDRVTP
ncbi:MAG: hypothetical protein QME79_07025 [Bacillota bacterium]|nr:hypothetical protein [Bacillota bacterium]